MSSALPKSKSISEIPTTTVFLGEKGLDSWDFLACHILGSDAKACAVLHECSDSKETWKQKSKLVIVSGLLEQCDQEGGTAQSWGRAPGVCHHLLSALQEPRCQPQGMGRRSQQQGLPV